jgi:hypothetical protein
VQATASRIGFSEQVYSDYYSSLDGSYLGSDKQDVDTGLAPLYLATVSGAFVHDTSIFGATSPIMGTRARFEVGPTFGTINYTNVVADWRGYDNITASECRPSATSQCPLYDRLYGSRMFLASAELRAPLVGLFTGRLSYGPVPVELELFADSGVAWTSFGYSRRRTRAGSVRNARTAGAREAARPISTAAAALATSARGSRGLTP